MKILKRIISFISYILFTFSILLIFYSFLFVLSKSFELMMFDDYEMGIPLLVMAFTFAISVETTTMKVVRYFNGEESN